MLTPPPPPHCSDVDLLTYTMHQGDGAHPGHRFTLPYLEPCLCSWTTDKGTETHITAFAQRFEATQQPAPVHGGVWRNRPTYAHRYMRSSRQSGVERFNGEVQRSDRHLSPKSKLRHRACTNPHPSSHSSTPHHCWQPLLFPIFALCRR